MLLNNQWNTEEIKRTNRIRKQTKYLKTNENENAMVQNLGDTAKAVLRVKFTVIQAYIRKQEKSHIKNLILYLEEPEKE